MKALQISRKAWMLLQSTLDNKCIVARSEIKARRTAEGRTVHSQLDHGQASPKCCTEIICQKYLPVVVWPYIRQSCFLSLSVKLTAALGTDIRRFS